MAKYLPDLPAGPLDKYRSKASFDWKKLKVFLETEEILEFQNELYKELQQFPILFSESLTTPTLDEQKRISAKRTFALGRLDSLKIENMFGNLRKPVAALNTMFQLDPATVIKHSIASGMFPSVVQGLGTERHAQYFDDAFKGDILGAYCLTEIGHGSNAKCMKTTATYDKATQEFILHSPNFEAAKCWAGVLGQMATHAIVYAQLITPDGVNHSLHAFVVKVRDPKTLLPYPGITVGDMGEKIGLNGVDNGFLMFNNYRIPRTDLLNKTGDVTEDGTYVTPYRDANKRYGASLGALSIGRVTITNICACYISHALTIALRYAAVRKQFGPDGEEEVPILEYQTHQCRLIPYLSVAYLLNIFGNYLMLVQYQYTMDSILGQNKDSLADLGLELHAVSSASKPVAGWVVRDGVQECREACAGHGYLKAAGIGDIKNAHDANCTYEGENHVLIQQTSNWLLKFWPLILQGQKVSSPLRSIDFLSDALSILDTKLDVSSLEQFVDLRGYILGQEENLTNNVEFLLKGGIQWYSESKTVFYLQLKMYFCFVSKKLIQTRTLWVRLLQQTEDLHIPTYCTASYDKCELLSKSGKLDSFSAKNESQVFFLRNLGVVYIQHFMMYQMQETIRKATDPHIQSVLTKLLALYGIWSLEKHILTLYQGGYASGPLLAQFVQEAILKLCSELKDDSVALVDVFAPPDFLIKSVLGRSDGQVYKHLEDAMVHAPGALSRPTWWKEITEKNIKSKL